MYVPFMKYGYWSDSSVPHDGFFTSCSFFPHSPQYLLSGLMTLGSFSVGIERIISSYEAGNWCGDNQMHRLVSSWAAACFV